jgi:mRNA interferase MazF
MKLSKPLSQWSAEREGMNIKRGDVFFADLSPVVGSEQGGVRPVLVIQNDVGNKYSPTVIVAAITSQIQKAKLPTHVEITAKEHGLDRDSVVLLEQIRTIDKQRLNERITHLVPELMKRVEDALQISLGLIDF